MRAPRHSPKFSETAPVAEWIRRFQPQDQVTAAELVDAMVLVTRDKFAQQMRELILRQAQIIGGVVSLYAERELPPAKDPPYLLFNETVQRPRRAYGPGPVPVAPSADNPGEVGSEGFIASFVTELCRERPDLFVSHAGPDEIRCKQVRGFMLVTDVIGSGRRASRYLDATWSVASVKSWASHRVRLRFHVVAYSATARGKATIEAHGSSPEVSIVATCPTVFDAFDTETTDRIKALCRTYDPGKRPRKDAFGFGSTGALIAFAHGCPNNVPRLLWQVGQRGWTPLFPSRITAGISHEFGDRWGTETLAKRLGRMRQHRLARSNWLVRAGSEGRLVVAVLAASSHGPRQLEVLARRTGLTIMEVEKVVRAVNRWGWLHEGRLTDSGHQQLAAVRSAYGRQKPLPSENTEPYFPFLLRAPRHV